MLSQTMQICMNARVCTYACMHMYLTVYIWIGVVEQCWVFNLAGPLIDCVDSCSCVV